MRVAPTSNSRTWPAVGAAWIAASAAALLVAGCGGGSDYTGPKQSISRVVVIGDSLADSGTFGFKFTVQNAASPAAGFPIWPELVARSYGIGSLCNFYVFAGGTFRPNATSGCTSYAIGGARVINTPAQGGAAGPQAVTLQLTQAVATAAAGGTWGAGDLILVDGGGNDTADLVGVYLGLASGAAGLTAYQTFLAQQLTPAQIGALLPQTNGPALAAGAYMQALAGTYYNSIAASTVAKGAGRVAILNIPDITLTPRFQAVLAGVAASTNAANAAALRAAIQSWIGAFNTQLKTLVGSDPRYALVDFNADFTDEVTNAASYGLTNATRASCPVTGVDSSGLPDYTFPTCTSAALDAAPPAGLAAGWWQRWAFSDGFHPTPYGHQLLAGSVSRALARAGWL